MSIRAVGVELHPVGTRIGRLLGAEHDLVRAVGRERELAVVDVGQHPAVEATVDGFRVDGEGDVRLLAPHAEDAVRAVAADLREVVDRVGVVTLQLARRIDDQGHARVVGIALDEELRHAREHLGDVAVALHHVDVLGEALLVQHVAVADLGEQGDELVERLGGLRCSIHARSP